MNIHVKKMTFGQARGQCKWLYNVLDGYKLPVLLIILLSSISALLGVLFAWVIKNFIDVATGELEGNFLTAALFCILVLAAQIIVNSADRLFSAKARIKHANSIRSSLFRKLMAADWQTFCLRHSGDYNNRMLSDVDIVSDFLIATIPAIFATFIQLTAAAAVLLTLEPYLALLTLLISPIFILLGRVFAKSAREANLNLQQAKGENLSYSQDFLQNMAVLRTFEQQTETIRKLSYQHDRLLHWNMRRTKLAVLSNAVLSVSWSATYLLSLVWGAVRLSAGAISYGNMSAYLQLVGQIQGPLRSLASQIPGIIAASASAERLIEVLDMPEEELSIKHDERLDFTNAGIRLENVKFEYKADDSVLYDVDMEIKPGSMTALIGPTGEGKSTITRLLLALVMPLMGKVLLTLENGKTVEVSASTRRAFTYVPQGNTVLSGTVADNLMIAKADATQEEMKAALLAACAWEFVEQLPEGLKTMIGECGTGLSEGQAQRIAIARALLRYAPILLLDECTSALDVKTEERVLLNIRKALNGRTCLIITHRETALTLCDHVYKLTGGFIQSAEQLRKKPDMHIYSAT